MSTNEVEYITDEKVINRLSGVVISAIGMTMMLAIEFDFQHRRYAVPLEDFYSKLRYTFQSYLLKSDVTAATLADYITFARCDNLEVPQIDGEAIPKQIFGITGYSKLIQPLNLDLQGKGEDVLLTLAVMSLTCFAYDYVRQPLYQELMRRKAQEVHAECGC